MIFSKFQLNAVKALSKIAHVYTEGLLYDNKYKQQFQNGYQALKVFLDTYAYARQGAAAAYPQIAHECIAEFYDNGQKWHTPTSKEADKLWKLYKNKALLFGLVKENKARVNEQRNPMSPRKGIIKILALEKLPADNIACYIRNNLNKKNVHNAHKFLLSIRGIGDKIASFYMRDIAYFAKIDGNSLGEKMYLLQPIDTWLNQILLILFKSHTPKNLNMKQKLIMKLCREAGVSTISFNQGAWLFGSQIAENYANLETALKNTDKFCKILKKHIEKKNRYLQTVNKILNDF